MNRMLLVTYNVAAPRKKLMEAIKEYSGYWWHHAGVWIIYTPATPEQLFEHLRQFINEKDDNLFVVEIKKNYQGWLPETAWKWLNDRTF